MEGFCYARCPSVSSLACLDPMSVDYLKKVLTAKVYDVAIESPLEIAPTLSMRLGNTVRA